MFDSIRAALHPAKPPVQAAGTRLGAFLDSYLRPGTRDWAGACHLFPLIGYVVQIPLLHILLALLVWQARRGRETGVEENGREALNFHLNVAVWTFFASMFWPLHVLVGLYSATLCVLASLRAAQGEAFRYPLIVRPVQ